MKYYSSFHLYSLKIQKVSNKYQFSEVFVPSYDIMILKIKFMILLNFNVKQIFKIHATSVWTFLLCTDFDEIPLYFGQVGTILPAIWFLEASQALQNVRCNI